MKSWSEDTFTDVMIAQIIWASTTAVGMAISDDGSGGVYVVARYSPAGNV